MTVITGYTFLFLQPCNLHIKPVTHAADIITVFPHENNVSNMVSVCICIYHMIFRIKMRSRMFMFTYEIKTHCILKFIKRLNCVCNENKSSHLDFIRFDKKHCDPFHFDFLVNFLTICVYQFIEYVITFYTSKFTQ